MVTDSLLRGIRKRDVDSGIGVFHESLIGGRWSSGRTKVLVVLFRENALCRRAGVDSTLFHFAGESQPKKSGTISSSAPSPARFASAFLLTRIWPGFQASGGTSSDIYIITGVPIMSLRGTH